MNFRYSIKVNISVNSGETEEVLVLAPAACCPFEYLCCEFVFAFFYIFGQFKF